MSSFPIVGRRFSPAEFAAYCAGLDLKNTAPWADFVVRHNTGAPTLPQRPNGFSAQNMTDLMHYYADTQGWHAGPHLFIDDLGIWAFSDLRHPGVHTPSWNKVSWGVEQLGDYETDDYNSGRGLAVQRNAIAAIAALCHARGLDSHSMRDHREDPATTHRDCPGASCHDGKAAFMDAVHAYIVGTLTA